MEKTKLFLTENRRKVLAGESDWSHDSILNEKSRIRVKSRDALEELIEVAASPEIDNSTVFDPVAVNNLLEILLTGRTSGLIAIEQMPDYHRQDEPDREYASELANKIREAEMKYQYEQNR